MVIYTKFDQAFSQPNERRASKRPSRLITATYDEEQDSTRARNAGATGTSASAPLSPCPETYAAISITGKFSDIDQRYQVDHRVIGSGCQGVVRECIDRGTGVSYAVKTISKERCASSAIHATSLAREILLLQETKHDGIVRLVDVFEDAEYVHLVTDLCRGGELYDRIVRKSSSASEGSVSCFAENEAARVLHQILSAVSYMHKNGLVHRDIKPENLLFESADEDSPVKLIDFGLARRHSPGDRPMTSVVGTQYYVAPEVLSKRYGRSCDLFSIGVIAYVMMCGYPPFNGASVGETHMAILMGRYRFEREDWRGVGGECKDFIRGLLRTRRRMTAEEALGHPWLLKHARG